MEKTNQEKMEKEIKLLESIYQRELNEDELLILKKRYDNIVAKKVELRPGEVDVRSMPQSEYRQLSDRNMRNMIAWMKIISQQLSDLYFLIGGVAKEQGVKDPQEAYKNFSIECEEKMKENE